MNRQIYGLVGDSFVPCIAYVFVVLSRCLGETAGLTEIPPLANGGDEPSRPRWGVNCA